MKAIVFDFDGVIIDSFNFHLNCLREFSNIQITANDLKESLYGNIFENKNEALSKINWDKYHEYIIEQGYLDIPLNEDVKDVLDEIEKDFNLFVITSGSKKLISKNLENNNVLKNFKEVLGAEDNPSKVEKFNMIKQKYNLDNKDILFITDTLGDIKEAKKLDIKTIAVNFGFHEEEVLQKGNPDSIISNFNQIYDNIGIINSQNESKTK